MTDQPRLPLSGFICTMRDRYIERAGLDPDAALGCVLPALECWEDADEPVELTEACAHAIVDEDLSHWTD